MLMMSPQDTTKKNVVDTSFMKLEEKSKYINDMCTKMKNEIKQLKDEDNKK